MSEARDNFYSWVSQNQVSDVKDLMNYVKELEAEKAELVEALKTTYDFNDHWGIGNYHRWGSELNVFISKLLQKHIGV